MYRYGPQVQNDGAVLFRLWAPACETVRLAIEGHAPLIEMTRQVSGWHEVLTDAARVGTLYRFVLPGGLQVPDPASRFQPQDVHGPSEVVDPRSWFWSDGQWKGRPWSEAVIYELHVGTFTSSGTFAETVERLDYLRKLGVTAIQLMPVAEFPGRWNWGYDGVLPYAPDASYGRPEELKALVEAGHRLGLMVFLDVVYNHFGPEGNYLSQYAPQFFNPSHKTPWGPAVNFETEAVRQFFIENALYWVRAYHLDGLRLDAVHAIVDENEQHLLVELAERLRAAVPGRQLHLILENDENEAARLERDAQNNPRFYTAQWNDDVHHVLHTAATNEDKGYYGEYRGDTQKLGRALAEGFVFQGQVMKYRGRNRGELSVHLPPNAFIAFLQNHDQIGNRAFGDRVVTLALREARRATAAIYLLLPQIPMLFMGEEWETVSPFPFFCDFQGELAEAVRQGRVEEFSRFPEFQDPLQRQHIPDPLAESTFISAKLKWDELLEREHQQALQWYRSILKQRREQIVPIVDQIRSAGRFSVIADAAVEVRWPLHRGELVLACNLSGDPVTGFPKRSGRLIWEEGETKEDLYLPWTVRWWVSEE